MLSARKKPFATAGALLAATIFSLSACSLASPASILDPYAPSDGSSTEIAAQGGTSIKLRNFLIVSAGQGAPGVVVGAIANDTAGPVPIELAILAPDGKSNLATVSFLAPPGRLTSVGPGGESLQIPKVAALPGTLLTMHVQAGNAGGDRMTLPVLAPQAEYAGITPSPVPSTQPTTSASPGAASTEATPSPTPSS